MILKNVLLAVSFGTCVKKERDFNCINFISFIIDINNPGNKLLEVLSCLDHVQLVCVCVCFIIPQQLAWASVDVPLGKMGVSLSISGCFSLFVLLTHSLPPHSYCLNPVAQLYIYGTLTGYTLQLSSL